MTKKLGYDDTPFLPGSRYRVHDDDRPRPPVVTPGAAPGQPPSDAIVLFDGTNLDQWVSSKDGGKPTWIVKDGYMEAAPRQGGVQTTVTFGDCQLHVEWAAPAEVSGDSQGRGNSGVFLMGLYEIQVLDCYDNPTYADGVTGSVYGQWPALVNACRKPGAWQTYDIIWEGPRFEDDKLVRPAFVTVLLNGIVVQNHTQLLGPTTYRDTVPYKPHPPQGPLALQDHHNPVRFRNIWYRPLGDNSL
ncbi:MAG: DUF1080 domain-containing protein [Eubacteriales bacterium]|nr:DUF1080 domain-containing protein [Clostridiales bacterium]MDD2440777.1 DUF1080 domain-containing protein [Eubacteriales bacterium]MDD4139492.1 DUF1080 domain-containing protein [Eubacteriales bacterium]MDD4743416.1 DUF1080 domain-containing protein [Eubacteriales bacterium]